MSPIEPTERELQILKILWQRERGTVREVWKELLRLDREADPEAPELAYTTVLTMFQIMERKGLVGHEAIGRTYHYFPVEQRESTITKMIGSFVDRVFDGAREELLIHAIDPARLSLEEISRLEEKLAEVKKNVQSRKNERKRQ